MINSIIAFFSPGTIEILMILILYCVPIAFVVWIIKMVIKNKNENIRLRLEVGKLADELEKVRKTGIQNNDNNLKGNSV